jgi:hypothetical protein
VGCAQVALTHLAKWRPALEKKLVARWGRGDERGKGGEEKSSIYYTGVGALVGARIWRALGFWRSWLGLHALHARGRQSTLKPSRHGTSHEGGWRCGVARVGADGWRMELQRERRRHMVGAMALAGTGTGGGEGGGQGR